MSDLPSETSNLDGIAIVGMAGRFPGAMTVGQFWKNLCNGVESIASFSNEELENTGVDSALIKDPNYVKKSGAIEGADVFDAEFFGINPREAELMDPQHRLILECAWEALEDAGYVPEAFSGLIGVYAGNGMNHYLLNNLASNPALLKTVGDYQTMIGNANDYVATRISYKLNLRGPSMTILSACSTSMVAIHTACQSLLSYQCDMALAGGISLKIPPRSGYLYEAGHILSPDGHCRPFDSKANGTVWGEGLGLVTLKRLEEAVQDNDSIYAVIKSSAINNDGSSKVGFTAPSVDGQAAAIALAHALAGVEPQSISYVEAHGTGTPMGDPIELAGLAKAFKNDSGKKNFCALGSVKSNIGHLDAAAGVAGLIKTALALKHELIPPTLHFSTPNPNLNLEQSSFFVNTTLMPWKKGTSPRRAGVSSFGIGGTNAHAVLEESPEKGDEPSSKTWHILPLSARSENALDNLTGTMTEFLKNEHTPLIADIAHTLQAGRRAFKHRRIAVGQTTKDTSNALDSLDAAQVFSGMCPGNPLSAVFMFSGQGSQYVKMSKQLYENEPFFRSKVDFCSAIVSPLIGVDLCGVLFPKESEAASASESLLQTAYTQPALFVVEYSLASLLMQWGVQPTAMIGHSVGEYVAACLSGVFEISDALRLIVERAKLMQQQPSGVMLSVSASESQIKEHLDSTVEIALINEPRLCVVGGPAAAIDALEKRLTSAAIQHRRLRTSHAFHTSLMDGALKPFTDYMAKIPFKAPAIPFISNVSGTWITAEQACDPLYWASHIRSTVQFSNGVKELLCDKNAVFVEIGPGNTLCTLVAMQATNNRPLTVIQTMPHSKQNRPDMELYLGALGRLWIAGAPINWSKCYENESRKRVSLPAYPFERHRYWVEPAHGVLSENAQTISKKNKINKPSPQSAHGKSCKPSTHPRPNLSYEYQAPTTAVEILLAEIWQCILGIEPIGINDNFFDLGGHSLLAVQMFSQIQSKTGINLPLATLFAAPTIHELSSHVPYEKTNSIKTSGEKPKSAANPWKYLVPIKPQGKLTPFFCIHGVGGNVLNYYQLTQHLDAEQPLYGLQCRGLDGTSKPFTSVIEMAQAYVKELRQVQPKGPYYLGGGSMGGLVAFEMAVQLSQLNEPIGLLAMFDSYCLRCLGPTVPIEMVNNDKEKSEKRNLISQIRHSVWCRVRDQYKMALCAKYRLLGQAIPHELRYWLVEQKNDAITVNYLPKPYKGPITMFRATLNSENVDPYRGWKNYALGGMKFFDYPVEHDTMIEQVEVMKKLNEVLQIEMAAKGR